MPWCPAHLTKCIISRRGVLFSQYPARTHTSVYDRAAPIMWAVSVESPPLFLKSMPPCHLGNPWPPQRCPLANNQEIVQLLYTKTTQIKQCNVIRRVRRSTQLRRNFKTVPCLIVLVPLTPDPLSLSRPILRFQRNTKLHAGATIRPPHTCLTHFRQTPF